MKFNFITLASVLALTSVNALPAAEGPAAAEEMAMAPASSAIAQANDGVAAENNKDLDSSRVELISYPIVDDVLELIEVLVDFIVELLVGDPIPTIDIPALQELIEYILELLGFPGSTMDIPAQPLSAATPASEEPVDIMKTFIANMKAGYSGMDAANNDPVKVISALLSLYSKIPKEMIPK